MQIYFFPRPFFWNILVPDKRRLLQSSSSAKFSVPSKYSRKKSLEKKRNPYKVLSYVFFLSGAFFLDKTLDKLF